MAFNVILGNVSDDFSTHYSLLTSYGIMVFFMRRYYLNENQLIVISTREINFSEIWITIQQMALAKIY